jgi:hypothetical protein
MLNFILLEKVIAFAINYIFTKVMNRGFSGKFQYTIDIYILHPQKVEIRRVGQNTWVGRRSTPPRSAFPARQLRSASAFSRRMAASRCGHPHSFCVATLSHALRQASSHRQRGAYTIKKAFRYPCPQPGCHLLNSPWAGHMTSSINYSCPGRVW